MKSNLKIEFGKRVRERRHHLGLSQTQVAERSGLHRTYLSDVELGKRNLSLVAMGKLAKALEVSLAKLFAEL